MFAWFVRICNTWKNVGIMSLHHLWFDFFNVVKNMIDLKLMYISVVMYLNKMFNVLQAHPCTFLHIPIPKFSKGHVPWIWIFLEHTSKNQSKSWCKNNTTSTVTHLTHLTKFSNIKEIHKYTDVSPLISPSIL
jgi:hypothetical protein